MNTATATPNAIGHSGRPSIGTLTSVELRKMSDTVAGFWMLLFVAGSVVATVVLSCLTTPDNKHAIDVLFYNSLQPVTVLLPIVGILLISSEWTQRTTLTTFSLVPQRSRVILAKVLAGSAVSLVAVALCLGVSAIATAVSAGGVPNEWALPLTVVGQALVLVVATTTVGIGFGALFLASAPAIVSYLTLPLAVVAIGHIDVLRGIAHWVDMGAALDPLGLHVMNGTEWAHAGSSLAIWMVLPLAVGFYRITGRDIAS
ncbi:MAG: ABC transporter permease [Solirubrobacterales bacterium]